MTAHFFSLLGLAALCGFWAVFQLWLKRYDPEGAERSNKCGGCNGQCQK